MKFRSGKAALASRLQGARGLQTHYLLQPEVRQRPEPNALPPLDEIQAAMLIEARRHLDRQTKNNE